LSQVLRGAITIDNATIMNKYFTQSDSSSAATPKLILLSADDAFLSNVLGLFNNLFIARPEPGAYVAVDFYECQWNCYWYDRFKVEVVYCPDGNNLANTCTILNFNRWIQDYRGGARATNFESWITKGLAAQASANSYPTQAATDVCATAYTTTGNFNSTSRFYTDLLKEFGF
jgi:hypothetical protein